MTVRPQPAPRWWLPAKAVYVFRIVLTQNAGVALAGFYAERPGWQCLYWQDVRGPVMVVLVTLGAPHARVDHALLVRADWGGMRLFSTGLAMLYAGLD